MGAFAALGRQGVELMPFAVRIGGDSMIGAGLFEGDIAIVNRALNAVDGSIILALLAGEFTIKRYRKRAGRAWLHAENPVYRDIVVRHRFGYRRLHVLLRREGEAASRNKVYRLYRGEGLAVRKRKGRRRAVGHRAPLALALLPNMLWSLDFVHDQLACGRRFRILNVVDDATRECLLAVFMPTIATSVLPMANTSGKRRYSKRAGAIAGDLGRTEGKTDQGGRDRHRELVCSEVSAATAPTRKISENNGQRNMLNRSRTVLRPLKTYQARKAVPPLLMIEDPRSPHGEYP